jgi:3-phosphoshikimate 1-carboxyvinyltransferase
MALPLTHGPGPELAHARAAQHPYAVTTLIVRGRRPIRGTAHVPDDKSISHRALILGALADGPTRIADLSPCHDVRRTLDCLTALRVTIDRPSTAETVVHGRGVRGLIGPLVVLDCGDSGTTMRLLTGALAGQRSPFVLDGAPGLRRRPMDRVIDPLVRMGALITADHDGRPPVRGQGGELHGTDIALTHASAQVGSAVLLAGLNAVGTTVVHYPMPVRDHTERMLADMGAPIAWTATTTRLDGPVSSLRPPGGGMLRIPGDLSGAAFLLGAAVITPGSSVRVDGVGVNPGRTGILDILGAMGAPPTVEPGPPAGAEPTATITAGPGAPRAIDVSGPLVPRAIDEIPLVAVLATAARGRTTVRDASELRVKESDRVDAIVDGLTRMGARIEARADGFVVDGPTPLHGAAVDGRGDHRIVMALAVAALAADAETRISDAGRVDDSFPGFVEVLAGLGADVRLVP